MKQTKGKTLFLLALLVTMVTVTSQTAVGQQDRWSRTSGIEPKQMDKFSGYYNQTEVNLATGLGEVGPDFSKGFGGLTTVNGYRFSESLQAGVGIGYLQYDAGGVLPLYLDGRYYLLKRRNKVFAGGAAGYLLPLVETDHTGGLFIAPVAGIEVPLKNRSSLTFSGGLSAQWLRNPERDAFANFKVGILLW
ncbi:hypothetical protein BA6E_101341 [Bacteroidales bacterium 6E]|nr:hypothetical protein BA6E_101341 [Bacteroidales bacterium 6E]